MRSTLPLTTTAAPLRRHPLALPASATGRRRAAAAVAPTSSSPIADHPRPAIATQSNQALSSRHRRRPSLTARAGGGFNNNQNDDDDEDEAEARAAAEALASVPPREARLIGALLQVGLTGSLAVLLGAATGTEPIARLWRGLGGSALFSNGGDDAGAILSAVAAGVSADGTSSIPASIAAAAPYFLPLLLLDALLFAIPWSMPDEFKATSPQGRRCLDARAAADEEAGPTAAKLLAGLALHRAVALLPPRLVTAAFADGPDDDDEDEVQKVEKANSTKPQTREERLAALGLAPVPSAASATTAPKEPPRQQQPQPIDDAAALPLPAEAGLIAARELSKELLQRGVLLVFSARWLTDRFLEGGAGDAGGDGGAFGLGLPASAVAASAAEQAEAEEEEGGGGGGGAAAGQQQEDDEDGASSTATQATVNPALLLEFRVLEATEAALGSLPPAVAGGLSLARLVSLAAAANACFVEQNGNLAATLFGAVAVNEVLGLGYRVWAKKAAEEEKGRRQAERKREKKAAARGR